MSREILDECMDFILRTDDPVAERKRERESPDEILT